MPTSMTLVTTLIALLIVVAVFMVWWLLRQDRRVQSTRSTFGPSTQQGGRHSRSHSATRPGRPIAPTAAERERAMARARLATGSDPGPETVLSYLQPDDSVLPVSGFDASRPSQLPHGFAQTTRPQAWQRDADSAPLLARPRETARSTSAVAAAQAEGMQRVTHALNALNEGPADQAWNALKGFRPEPGQSETCLETLERIA
ncbi:MAG: hypothetical protein V4532_09165, partial [Pseudomonadota bacterium]